MPEFIPFHQPTIGVEEITEVTETLKSGWLTTGPRVAQFERDFSASTGAGIALAVNSGTAALHLALTALGIGPSDEVITTPMTFCATIHAILHVGATPVLADVGEDGNIDPAAIEQRITPRTKAILPVHLAGLPCKMGDIWDIAKRHSLYVVEDAAHAVGAKYDDRPIGAHPARFAGSDACAFSFYATKNITTGEGGMVTTHRTDLAEKMRILALHGTSRDAWSRYTQQGAWHYDVLAHGYKYNLSDLQAALGIHQLRKLESFIERRRQYADIYNREFAEMEELECPPDNNRCRHAWHLYILRLNLTRLNIDRAEFVRELQKRGIGVSVHFIPIPLHSYFRRLPFSKHPCDRALTLYQRIISLPLYPAMTEAQVRYVGATVRLIVETSRRTATVVPVGRSAL